MKLRNKRTGELKECVVVPVDSNGYPNEYQLFEKGESLAELNEEWCDYEEPKDHWHIGCEGDVFIDNTESNLKIYFSIDNDFNSREEAELAVRKLRAWKRLKDKGFRFTLAPGVGALDVDPGKFQIDINADMPGKWFCCDAVQKDLDLLFGGEE